MEKFKINIKELYALYFYTNSMKVKTEFLEEKNKITKTIPATIEYLGCTDHIMEDKNFLMYLNQKCQDVSINKQTNTSYLSLDEEQLFIPDLIYLMIGMIANGLQEQGLYFMQGAVAKYNNEKSILILGDPNVGKTTIVYKLISLCGYSLISNDNVLVGVENGYLKTYSGTKEMQMRLGGLKLYCPEIVKKMNLSENEKENINEWNTKIYINEFLDSINAKYSDESVITDIFCVNTMKSDSYYIREIENIDKTLLIYEHLTKQIRSNRYALTSFNYPLPSFENEKYMQERYNMSCQIADSIKMYDAKGDINSLVKKMKRI